MTEPIERGRYGSQPMRELFADQARFRFFVDPERPEPASGFQARLAHAAAAVLDGLLDTGQAWTGDRFTELALQLAAAQYESVPIYRAWCDHALGSVRLDDLDDWRDVPALPICAYKQARVAGHAVDAATWTSSGTTGAATSTHILGSLAQYDASLLYGCRRALVPDGVRPLCLQLAPNAAEAPQSSLSHMLDSARLELCVDGGTFVDASFKVDPRGAWSALDAAAGGDQPVLVLATSFALVQLLEATADEQPVRLPPGSRLMDTGGYKGRTRELTRGELLELVGERLGIEPAWCENEYGMSELSSQAWLGTIARSVGQPLSDTAGRWQPPWFRTRVVDPLSLTEVANGDEGLLVHHDLANVWSCAAVRSEDWGRRLGDSYELLGRAPGAELRGCSLQLEDVL
jgi:hypothetical protein